MATCSSSPVNEWGEGAFQLLILPAYDDPFGAITGDGGAVLLAGPQARFLKKLASDVPSAGFGHDV